MAILIYFDIPFELYNDSNKVIKFRKEMIPNLVDSIKYNSFKNSCDEIISDVLGIILLLDCKIIIQSDNILNIQLNVNLQNPNLNPIINFDMIEEIIWRVFPATFDSSGILQFSMDGIFRIHNYNLKILDTPQNIIFSFDPI